HDRGVAAGVSEDGLGEGRQQGLGREEDAGLERLKAVGPRRGGEKGAGGPTAVQERGAGCHGVFTCRLSRRWDATGGLGRVYHTSAARAREDEHAGREQGWFEARARVLRGDRRG